MRLETKTQRKPTRVTRSSVVALLDRHRIDYRAWGTGTTHPLSELVRRLQTESMTLREDPLSNDLLLTMNVVVVHVYYQGELGNKVLYEEGQLFHASDKYLQRHFEGIGETLRRNESPRKAAERALSEELGQSQSGFRDPTNYPALVEDNIRMNVDQKEESKKWPGLEVKFDRRHYSTTIGDRLYRDQYTETTYIFGGQPFKTTTFVWKNLPDGAVWSHH